MSDKTKSILIGAALVAAAYIVVEHYAKPNLSGAFGVRVK